MNKEMLNHVNSNKLFHEETDPTHRFGHRTALAPR